MEQHAKITFSLFKQEEIVLVSSLKNFLMGAICGIIYKNGAAKEKDITAMLNSMAGWNPDHTFYVLHENAAIGSHILYSMTYSQLEKQPWESDKKIWLYDARFDEGPHLEEEYPELQSNASEDPARTAVIEQSYKKEILEYLESNIKRNAFKGDFAIAEWNKEKKILTLVRDHLGTRPLYYTETDNFFAFASEMKALFVLPGVIKKVDELWIADSISTVKSEKFRTPYQNIYRLLPAHKLYYQRGEIKLEKYWELESNPEWENLEETEAIRIFSQKLNRAIERRTKHALSIGSELSGGLDSSGVTALAHAVAKQNKTDFYALSHAFSSDNLEKFFPYKDESEYSRELIQFSGVENHVMCTAEGLGIIDILDKTRKIESGPTQQAYNIFADNLYDEAAKRDVKLLLSGFGGDESVTSQGGGYLQELRERKDWSAIKNEIRNSKSKKASTKLKARLKFTLLRYLPRIHDKLRKLKAAEDWRVPKWKALALSEDFSRKMKIEERYFERIGFPDDPDVRKRQYKKIFHDHVSQRFEYSYLAALYRGMEYAYPLWDVDLLEFYYSLPASLKVKNGVRRYIYRQAMKGVLPEKIRTRNDKTGATIPTVQQRFMKDYDAIADLIKKAASKNSKHYLDYQKLLEWQERIKNRGFKDKIPANPGAFFNSLQILLWQLEEKELFND